MTREEDAAYLNDLVSGEGKKRRKPQTISAKDLLAQELAPVKWAIPDILPEGVTLLAGKPKMGKSWFALGISVAVATGGVALGTRAVDQGEVLYLALEDNERRIQRRLRKLLNGEDPPEDLHIATEEWATLDKGGVEDLEAFLDEHPDTRLIVVDTLKKIRPRSQTQRIYDADYEALEPLIPLAAKHGISILVVHHLRKLLASDPLDEISSSTGLTGGVDGALILKRDRGQADAFLHVAGRDIEDEQEIALNWNADTAGWTIAGDAEEYRISKERQKIINTLRESDKPLGPKDIAAELGKSDAATRKLLRKMVTAGQIRECDYGLYSNSHTGHSGHSTHSNGPQSVTDDETEGHTLGTGESSVTGVTTVTGDSRGNGHTPTGPKLPPLTPEEVQELQRLKRDGMSTKLAREEILKARAKNGGE